MLNLFKIGKPHFGYFDKVLARLDELNDLFTIEDWNTLSNGRTFFYTACSRQAFPAVMNYKIWVGRAAELNELWNGVDDSLRNGNIVSTATEYGSYENNYYRHYTHYNFEYRVPYKTHATNSYLTASRLEREKFTLSDNSTKEDLFATNELGTTPLDDPRTWKEIDKIMEFFRKKGTTVTKADFLRTNAAGTTYFERAEDFAAARAVRIGLRAQGEKLVLADITDPNFKKKFEWNVREFSSRTKLSNDQTIFRTLMIDPDQFVSTADSLYLGSLVEEGAYPVSGNNLASAALNGELFKADFIMSKLQQLHKDTPEVILEILNTEHDVKHPEHNNSFTATALEAVEYYFRSIKGPYRGGMNDLFTRVNNKALEDLKKKLAPENWVGKLKELQEFAERVKNLFLIMTSKKHLEKLLHLLMETFLSVQIYSHHQKKGDLH